MPNGGIQPISDAAVVGAGPVGRGIALSLALGGFKVVLVDSSQETFRLAVDPVVPLKATTSILSLPADNAQRTHRPH